MVTTKAAKAERLLNLVIALLNAPTFRTAAWIRAKVAGYGDAPSEEAFLRTFERDKKELRELGVPLQTPPNGGDGYRIPRSEFTLPPLSFTPAETAALALAGRLWETTALDAAGSGALRKIRDAEAADPADPAIAAEDEGAPPEDSVVTLLQPRVRTSDPAFEPMLAAVRAGRIVEFDYRKDPGGPAEPRRLQPWGLVSFRGRWYVIGHDDRRGDRRTFRLSRITGTVRTAGRVTVRAPAGIDLLAAVAGSVQRPVTDRQATVRVRSGAAVGLRRSAVDSTPIADRPGWDRVRIPLGPRWDTARQIAAHGPDVVVEEPADLIEATVALLAGTLASVRTGAAPGASGPGEPDVALSFDELGGEGSV